VTKVLYPGSFDPFHNGHRELVETASYLFDEVVVAAIRNPGKDALFTLEEREEIISEAVAHLDNVTVMHFAKLVVDVATDVGANFIVKGLRGTTDFDSEMTQAQVNLNVRGCTPCSSRRRRRTPSSPRSTCGRSPASAATCRPWCPRAS